MDEEFFMRPSLRLLSGPIMLLLGPDLPVGAAAEALRDDACSAVGIVASEAFHTDGGDE